MAGDFDPPSSPGSNPPPPLHPPAPPPGYSPVAPAPPTAYPYAQPPPEGPPNGSATAALVLGITSLALLVASTGLLVPISLPCAIVAWVYGSRGLRRVRTGETNQGESQAKAGRICGIVGVGLSALALLFWGAIVVVAVTND
ncbi:MAG: DUF4190 domain-containing protein [Solirubrobacteraceae bacterium]